MIDIKGIVRNTPPSIGQDGELEDVIGLRRENGAYRPIPQLEPLVENLGYTKVFIHENAGYTHLIGILDGNLYYFANLSDSVVTEITPQFICATDNETAITQIGNVINITNASALQFAIWYNGAYITINTAFDGAQDDTMLLPTGRIDLRVEGNTNYRFARIPDFGGVVDADTYRGVIAKSLAKEKEDGRIHGFIMACTAIELYDGSYILHSNPVILGQAYDVEARFTDLTVQGEQKDYTDNVMFAVASTSPTDLGDDIYEVEEDNVVTILAAINHDDTTAVEIRPSMILYNTNVVGDKTPTCSIRTNKLQIKRNGLINTDYNPLIKSISIFITSEVSMYDDSSIVIGEEYIADGIIRYYYGFPKIKTNAQIKSELESLELFYKVKEYNIDEWNALSDDWVDVDLQDKLDVLTSQEKLPIDNLTHHSLDARVQYVYNSALHIADYNLALSRGFPYNYFFANESLGQFTASEETIDVNRYIIWVKTILRGSDSYSEVVRYAEYLEMPATTLSWAKLQSMLSYPDRRATRMTFYAFYFTIDGDIYKEYEQSFDLKAHPFFNFAYYIDEGLKPFGNLFVDVDEPSYPIFPPSEINESITTPNVVKVSQTNNPFVFPAPFTYPVGNGTVRALCSNTIALSTGQFGEFPVYVFCSDGIYGLYLGGGEVNYSSVKPISREVINNKNVKAIDNGVVFITDKGVMVISGSQVQEISVPIEGRCFDFTDSSSDEYLQVFRTAVNHDNLVLLISEISTDNFLTYISGAVMGYNYIKREVWFTNPAYSYTYIFSRGAWYKVAQDGVSYTSNYPNEYILKQSVTAYDGEWISGASYVSASKIFTLAGHGLSNGDIISFKANTGVLPTGISAYTTEQYYIINKEENTFQICATADGTTAVVTSNNGTAGWQFRISYTDKYTMLDISSENTSATVPTMFLTRPLKLTGQDFKAMITAVIRGRLITNNGTPLEVGDEAQGGTVVAIENGGLTGLVAAIGAIETTATFANAITACQDAVIGGYNDWYLPDIEILAPVGAMLLEGVHHLEWWSSTEVESNKLKAYYITDEGGVETAAKTSPKGVLPFRTFDVRPRVGIYIFGSYDCKKWGFLGGGEKIGDIRDLGARTARTDCKYFRIGFVGDIDVESTIDYIELEAKKSITNKKLR